MTKDEIIKKAREKELEDLKRRQLETHTTETIFPYQGYCEDCKFLKPILTYIPLGKNNGESIIGPKVIRCENEEICKNAAIIRRKWQENYWNETLKSMESE